VINNITTIIKKYPSLIRAYYACMSLIPDKQYTSWHFRRKLGYGIDWKDPKTFNEKLQWLKLYWNEPLATICADKYQVRDYIIELGLEDILNNIYGVYNSVEEIDIDKLPNAFVLKATHASGLNIICKDKSKIDWDKAFREMRRWFKINYYNFNRERMYKDIIPRIICERYLDNEDNQSLIDYKFLCFNGEPLISFVCLDRFDELKVDFYDIGWNKIPFSRHYPNSSYEIPRPELYEAMLEICKVLSQQFPFVRVDLYEVKGKIYFGELTFIPGNGTEEFTPFEYDKMLGDLIQLPIK